MHAKVSTDSTDSTSTPCNTLSLRSNDPQGITATRLGSHIGARVDGVDLGVPLGDAAFARVLDLFHQNGVIFLRDQQLTPAQLASFSARFGELDIHHMTEHVFPDLPQVRVLSNEKKGGRTLGITRGGMHWHSDLSYKPLPALATLLYGVVCPPDGADTQFASMSAVYDALPAATKARIDGLIAVHDRNFRYAELYPNRPPLSAGQVASLPPVEHPLVCVHPVTGRASLFLARDVVSHIVGMELAESRRLIDELEAFATRPEFVYSHRWQAGDLVIWDNRCTLHRATPYEFDRYTRTLYRTQVRGGRPIAVPPASA